MKGGDWKRWRKSITTKIRTRAYTWHIHTWMAEYMVDEAAKRKHKLAAFYGRWKQEVRDCKAALKSNNSGEEDLGQLLDQIKRLETNVVQLIEH